MKRIVCILICVCLLITLCGCESRINSREGAQMTFPPVQNRYDAPNGDGEISEEYTRTLYLPSRDGLRLLGRTVTVPHSETDGETAEILINTLLSATEDDERTALGGNVTLQLRTGTPIEVSNGVCTVDLAPSALQLDPSELYTVGLAIASTLCELEEIQYVNILVAGKAVGMDIMGNLPMGSLNARPGEDLTVLWDQLDSRKTPLGENPATTPFSGVASLYFPLESGNGIMPETRMLSFAGQSPQMMAMTLMDALSAGSMYMTGVPEIPNLRMLQEHDPLISELDDGGRLVTLSFIPDTENILRTAGIELSCMMASVVYTLTTFVPGITAVSIRVGESLQTSLYHRLHGSVLFPGGIQKREQYEAYLVSRGIIYLSNGTRLKAVRREFERGKEKNPRILMEALMQGPNESEMEDGIEASLPEGLTGEDILGISLEEDTLLINLSRNFMEQIGKAGKQAEQRMAYSMVNTLCKSTGARYVYFFFDGESRENLAGGIFWAGQFLNNPGMVEENAG